MRMNWLLGTAALLLAAPSNAAWHQASSKHFIIYGDMPAEEMQAYAEKLEKFDAAARVLRAMQDPVVGDGNRIQVLVVPTLLDVRRLAGSAESGVAGYFVGALSGPYIVTPKKTRRESDRTTKIDPDTVFFHEYTHALMLQNTNKPMPTWLTEGFAEFFANPLFGDDGSVGLGTPATHRAEQLFQYRWAPLSDLIEGKAETLGYVGFWHQNYAQGWLLNHYLAFEPSRKGQIEKFVSGLEGGQPSAMAAKAAFGDIGQLENELMEYRRAKNFRYMKVDGAKLEVEPVKVTPLSPGAAEVMPMRIYVKTGYGSVSLDYVREKVRDIAKRYPNDALVLRTLAEVEYDDKNLDEAEKAADAALKIDPKSTEALTYKGRVYLARGKKTRDPAQLKEARRWFVASTKVDPEDPEPLFLYYRTYRVAGQAAPKPALDALHYASVLAPRDGRPAAELITEHLRQNNLKAAAEAVKPYAYMPHIGQTRRNDAFRVLRLIEAGDGAGALKVAEEEFYPKKDESQD
jgi:tetratricopeptide (TPR) repeat protein